MKQTKPYGPQALIGFVAAAVLSSALAFFIARPGAGHHISLIAMQLRGAAGTAPVSLFFGAAVIFLGGLTNYKAGRGAYRALAFGMLSFSLLFGQTSVWAVRDLWNSAWATSGSGVATLVAAVVFMYVAAQRFAKILQVRSIVANLWFTLPLAAAASAGMGIFAHYYIKYHIAGADIYVGCCACGAVFMTCAAMLIFKVSRSIGGAYQQAMWWLAFGLAVFALACWHETITTLWFNNGSTYTDYGYYLVPWTIAGTVLLYSAYRFRRMTAYVSGQGAPVVALTNDDYIDSIVAVAGLASRPEAIDPILDDLRDITAAQEPDVAFSPSQQQRLLSIYRRLEAYLSADEPLRTVSRDELLGRVTPPFRGLLEQSESTKTPY